MEVQITKNVCALTALAAKEKTRYALNGVHVQIQDNKVRLAATNGRFLGIISYDAGTNAETDYEGAIVPLDVLKDAGKQLKRYALNGVHTEQTLVIDGGKVIAHGQNKNGDSTRTESLAIEGHFPDVEGVFPKDEPTAVVYLNASMLKTVAETLSKFRDDDKDHNLIRLEVRDNISAVVFSTINGETDQRLDCLIMPVESKVENEYARNESEAVAV